MEAEAVEIKTQSNGGRWLRLALILIGAGITLGLLPYSWGRVLIASLLEGRPEPRFVGMLALGIAAVWALCLPARRGLTPRARWTILATVGVLWIAANSAVAWVCAGPFFPRSIVVVGYALASLWMMWLTWFLIPPMRWLSKMVVLLVLAGPCAGFFGLFEVEGLMGGNQVNFGWRQWASSAAASPALIVKSEIILPEGAEPEFDYPQFLGPTRTASLPDVRLNLDWSSNPPREVWRRRIGAGWGSFAVVGNRAVTQEQREQDECVVCYGLHTGDELWIYGRQTRFFDGYGGAGPRATPTIDSNRVYAVGATGLLSCLDLATGTPVWSRDILADNGAANQEYGVCCSPLVADEYVLVCPTGKRGPTLVAYHRDTGQPVWQAGRDRASYSSPVLAELGGVRQVIVFSSSQVASFSLATGDLLWDFPWVNSEGINAAQPILDLGQRNRVFVSTGYGVGSALFEVAQRTDGTFSVQPSWTNRRFQAKFTTPVYQNGCIYALDEGILACLDIETGQRRWREGRYGHGQILLAENALLVQAEAGEVQLVQLTDDGPVELGSIAALNAKTWNHPALAGPFLLVRNDREAVCYRLPPTD